MDNSADRRFARFAWIVLGWNLLVILWGALVRATGSGAGCGSHWPLCNGAVVPRSPETSTIIEFTHRTTSGLALLAVIGLVWLACRTFPKEHLARKAAWISLVLILVEALLGAGLVLLNYVEQNKSLGRAIYLSAHLTNTLLLVASLTFSALFAARPRASIGPVSLKWTLALMAALAACISGAVAALGDTLFPATSFAEGVRAELATDAHALLRLRLAHPVLAVLAGGYLAYIGLQTARRVPGGVSAMAGWAVAALSAIQLAAGAVNVWLLAPVWMQLLHLGLANLLWIALVIAMAEDSPGGAVRHA